MVGAALGLALGAATAAALAPLLGISSFRRTTTADAWANERPWWRNRAVYAEQSFHRPVDEIRQVIGIG